MMSSTLLAMAVAVMLVPANAKGFGHVHHHHQHHKLQCCGVPERSCISSSEECAVILPQYRCFPPWLTCCGNCNPSNCSGTCRAAGTCLHDEFTVTDCGTYCDCCESCQADDCIGRCVGNPDLCFDDEYINGTCTGDNCTCCVRCGEADSQCKEAGGSCVGAENECPCGYFPSPDFGCTSGDCICCVACIASRGCSGGHNPGRCVVNSTTCNADNEYISSDECASNVGDCSCCKTCTPDQICAREGGTCNKTSIGCGSGFRKSILGGGCCTDECICCVPDPCNSAYSKCTLDAYGTECRGSCRNKRLQYETNVSCGFDQTCCKACIPDQLCSEEGGICVTRNTGGCRGDLTQSNNGKCCNSELCVCCVPDPQKSCWKTTCLANDNPVVSQGGCNVIGGYRLNPSCGDACCKLCKPDSQCCSEGGRCYEGGCPPDLQVAPTGSCNDYENCRCCV